MNGTLRLRQRGFLLITVVIILAVLAAIAMMLSTSANMDNALVSKHTESATLGYVAESGMEHARWQLAQNTSCTGYANLPATDFAGGSYSATISPSDSSPVTITAIGTQSDGIVRTLTNSDVKAYQSPGSVTLNSIGDTYLYKWKSTWNHGASTTLLVSNKWADSLGYSFLEFDVSTIPAGSEISNASLQLWQNKNSSLGGIVGVHRVSGDWAEGTETGGVGTPSWDERDDGITWATPGGDYDPAPIATTSLPAAAVGFFSWDITSLVAAWVTGAQTNQGLILIPESSDTDVEFGSKEATDATQVPVLTITYACECGQSCSSGGGKNLLLVVGDAGSPSSSDLDRKAQVEPWGYAANLIGESEPQAAFDMALANNSVVYITDTISASALGDKVSAATIGIVNESIDLRVVLGFAGSSADSTRDEIDIIDNSHSITTGFALGLTTIVTSPQQFTYLFSDTAPGQQVLAETNHLGPQYNTSFVTLESGAELWGGGTAAGRRVQLPWGDGSFDINALNADGLTLLQRSLEWAEGSGTSATPGLLAHWKLDDAAGLTAMDSVGSNDGTLKNGPGWAVGQLDGALSFDGSNDYVAVPHQDDLSLTGQMTFIAWANNANTSGGYQVIVAKDDPGNGASNYWFGMWNDELVFGFWADGSFREARTSGVDMPEGSWNHLAASFDNTTDDVRLYVNGTEVLAGSLTWEPTTETADLWIGQSVDGENWDGMLDDVRIYDTVLGAADIADLATAVGNNNFILSTYSGATLGGLTFTDKDLAEYDPVSDTSILFFDGVAAALAQDIDAVHILANDHIVLSAIDTITLGGVTAENEDLIDYDPATDTGVLMFDGSAQFTSGSTDISALHIMDNGHLLLTNEYTATLGGQNFGPNDIVDYYPANDTATLFFDGDAVGFSGWIDAVHLLTNGHIVLSTNTPEVLGGLSFNEGDFVEYDPGTDTATLYFDGSLFSAAENVRSIHIGTGSGTSTDGSGSGGGTVTDNPIYLSTQTDADFGGSTYGDDDVASYDVTSGKSSAYFDGKAFSRSDEDINALHILADGKLVLSTTGNASLGGLDFGDDDLILYDPAVDTSTLLVDGSVFSSTNEDIDAVFVISRGLYLLSTETDAVVGGLSVGDDDVFLYDASTDSAKLFFDGALFSASDEDVNGVHILGNGNLLLSTTGNATLGGLTFGDDDLVEYDQATDTATLLLDGAVFSDTDEDIDAVSAAAK